MDSLEKIIDKNGELDNVRFSELRDLIREDFANRNQTQIQKFNGTYDTIILALANIGYVDELEFLYKEGKKITDASFDYASEVACCDDSIRGLNVLKNMGANIRIDDDYALRYIAVHGTLDTFKWLVENGCIVTDLIFIKSMFNENLSIFKYLFQTCGMVVPPKLIEKMGTHPCTAAIRDIISAPPAYN